MWDMGEVGTNLWRRLEWFSYNNDPLMFEDHLNPNISG